MARNYGGGIYNYGAATIANSTIRSNEAEGTAGIMNGPATHETCLGDPTMTITNSTIAKNRGIFGVGGLDNTGNLSIKNSTIISNVGPSGNGGLFNSGVLELQNTILSFNREPGGTACSRPFTSLGNNLIFDPLDCITLQPSDLTGDLGLGGFVDSGAPGNGRFPLLDTSQAIDRGNNDACSSDPALASDQFGQPRSVAGTLDAPRICDIGAVEFFPVVNNLVQLHEGELVTEFDPTPSPRAPAGTFVITATFDNISNERIFFPFFEVAVLELQRTFDTPPDLKCSVAPAEDQPVLLNADGGSGRAQCPFVTPLENEMTGGAGARLTPADSFNTPFEPGAAKTFQFRIGLQKQEPFIFFVNVLGEPRNVEFLC